VFSLLLACRDDEKDLLLAELYDAGVSGVTEHESPPRLEAFFADDSLAPALMERFAAWRPQFQQQEPRDYVRDFEASWPAQLVGERFYLAAAWDESPAPAGRLRLPFQPGMACGTGAHPCTQMCLAAMERVLAPGAAFLDVGAGSGILLIAAALLGAGRIVGCDIDHEAARIAARESRAPVFTGSARAIRRDSFDVVVANISGPAVDLMIPALQQIRRAGGAIILSGFREFEAPRMPPARLRFEDSGWACFVI
jgi:ribosomal protein L11 methyltransferase